MAFIVFEGLDGSGKSSLMAALEKHLSLIGQVFHRTREPGGTAFGDEIRNIILRKTPPNPVPRAELLLYEASRAQHVDEVILPNLKQGVWVLSDRFSASSVAFQAGGREISEADVHMLNNFATQGLEPDLTILLDLTVDESKKRRTGRELATGEAEDRIEAEADAFHERVREGFLKQARQNSKKWLVLDARKTPSVLFDEMLESLIAHSFLTRK